MECTTKKRPALLGSGWRQEVEDFRLSNGMAAANMLAEMNQADASATRCVRAYVWCIV